MATGIYSWSQTASSNDVADTNIGWSEGQAPSTVNNSARGMMSVLAKWRDDIGGVTPSNGVMLVAGSQNALTLATNGSIAALTNGWTVTFRIDTGLNNTGSCTLAVDGLAAKQLRSVTGAALVSGMLQVGGIYTATYYQPVDQWILHGAFGSTAGAVDLSGGATLGGTFTGNASFTGNLTFSGNNTLSGTNDFSSTSYTKLASGTTGQAPTATAGRVRYDSTLSKLTYADGAAFQNIVNSGMRASTAQIAAETVGDTYITADRLSSSHRTAGAWAYVTQSGGTYTLTNNFNCTSVTKNGTGDVTVNFTSVLANANYAAIASPDETGSAKRYSAVNSKTTSGVEVLIRDGANDNNQDCGFSVVCFD